VVFNVQQAYCLKLVHDVQVRVQTDTERRAEQSGWQQAVMEHGVPVCLLSTAGDKMTRGFAEGDLKVVCVPAVCKSQA
jgi:hypothetical protein